jgi:hypothetical protein
MFDFERKKFVLLNGLLQGAANGCCEAFDFGARCSFGDAD